MTVAVIGGTGSLGKHAVRLLGQRARVVSRKTGYDVMRPADAERALAGATAVLVCAGASVGPQLAGWRGFGLDVDMARVLAAHCRGVQKLVYVSAYHPPGMAGVTYVKRHEEAGAILAASGVPTTIVRPTGFFSSFALMVDMGRKGKVPCMGDGSVRTNPIHEADLAAVCVEALDDPRTPAGVDAGGPQVLSRQEICELVRRVSGSKGIRHVPPALVRAGSRVLRLFHPRIGQLMQFVGALGQFDIVAPMRGREQLGDYLAAYAAG